MMQYQGNEANARMGDPARTSADERRAFPRHIDCDDAGRARQVVNPAADLRGTAYAQQAQHARRRLDID
jgi:hypothetical protein